MNILVLGGGDSNEREVSLRSAAAVRDALHELGHRVTELDPADGMEKLLKAAHGADMVFPVLHGEGGEDGTIQAVLEEAGVRFLGSSAAVSRLCFDKIEFKKRLIEARLPTPAYAIVSHKQPDSYLFERPYVMKPIEGGSSIDTLIARKPVESGKKRDQLLRKYDRMLLEELIEGVEITVAMLDAEPLPVVEIVPPTGKEFDYANKYNGETRELCPPAHLDEAAQSKARHLAEQIHKMVGARHLSRIDIIVRPDGELTVLELNTLPGLTNQSLYPKAAEAAGYDFPQLMAKLIELVKQPVTSG